MILAGCVCVLVSVWVGSCVRVEGEFSLMGTRTCDNANAPDMNAGVRKTGIIYYSINLR